MRRVSIGLGVAAGAVGAVTSGILAALYWGMFLQLGDQSELGTTPKSLWAETNTLTCIGCVLLVVLTLLPHQPRWVKWLRIALMIVLAWFGWWAYVFWYPAFLLLVVASLLAVLTAADPGRRPLPESP